MTQTEILQLLNLLQKFDKEALNCNGNCYKCYYRMESRDYYLDNCPFLVCYEMIENKFNHCESGIRKEMINVSRIFVTG